MTKLDNPITLESLRTQTTQSKEVQLYDEIQQSGIEPPDSIIFDGQLHRFSSNGKRNDLSGWYVAHDGEIPAAAYGCWRSGFQATWRAEIGRKLTYIEEMALARKIKEAKEKRDAEFAAKRADAIETAHNILVKAAHAEPSHPYLVKKGIQPHLAMVTGDGSLVIPLYSDGKYTISSVQFIAANGDKKFLPGGKVSGCWCEIGDTTDAAQIFIAEGFATAATIHEHTGKPCIVAFNAGNLKPVAEALRSKMGISVQITICADLDESGVGEEKAREAAAATGASVVISPASTDFNDAVQQGLDITGILMPAPKKSEKAWLIPADELRKQQVYVKWLIKHWIPRNSLIMLHGQSGSGKSLITLDMVARIASNELIHEWHGKKVRHGYVVYLAGEGHIGIAARLEAWCQHNAVESVAMYVSSSGCNLNTPEGWNLAVTEIRNLGIKPDLIVVDTLHRFFEGEENSAKDAGTMIKACNAIMEEFDCSALLVHHTGVADGAQGRARGSSAWKGAMESEISIVPQEDDRPLEIHNVKSKDAACAKPVFMRIKSIPLGWFDEDGEQVTGGIVIPAEPVKKEDKDTVKAIEHFTEYAKKAGEITDDGQVFLGEDNWRNAILSEGFAAQTAKKYKQETKKTLLAQKMIAEFNYRGVSGYISLFPIDFITKN